MQRSARPMPGARRPGRLVEAGTAGRPSPRAAQERIAPARVGALTGALPAQPPQAEPAMHALEQRRHKRILCGPCQQPGGPPRLQMRTTPLVPAARSRPGLAFIFLATRRGVAERREALRCRRAPAGVLMTRHARRLRGALRPMTRDARPSALHRGDFRPCGTALPAAAFPPQLVQRSPSRPGRSARRAVPRLPGPRSRAAAAGRHVSLRQRDRLRRRPSMSETRLPSPSAQCSQ